nr:MAG TPA_asm: hypothetical protein [Caudoviricetes sp.]
MTSLRWICLVELSTLPQRGQFFLKARFGGLFCWFRREGRTLPAAVNTGPI